jgi:hypothetical protein
VLAKRRDELILSGRELGLSTYAMAKALGQTAQALRFRFEILDEKDIPLSLQTGAIQQSTGARD